jgi:hypothetical protein
MVNDLTQTYKISAMEQQVWGCPMVLNKFQIHTQVKFMIYSNQLSIYYLINKCI